jgi:cytochrome d ubiquinol oxidase subunit II
MNCIIFFVICAAMTMMATLLYVPHMTARVRDNPWLFSIALANMLAIANIPREFHHGRDWRAFLSSCAAIITLMGCSPEHFPEPGLQPAQSGKQPDDLQRRLVAENARHHAGHRGIIGVPVVIAYTVSIYWIFRGKVKLDRMSY